MFHTIQTRSGNCCIAVIAFQILFTLRYYVRFRIAEITISKVRGFEKGDSALSTRKEAIKPHFFTSQIKENQTSVFNTAGAWLSDSYLAVGILGFGFYVLLGITSLPSVSNALSWREFSFVQVSFT